MIIGGHRNQGLRGVPLTSGYVVSSLWDDNNYIILSERLHRKNKHYSIFYIPPMPHSHFLTAVCFAALFTGAMTASLRAGETPSLAERQRAVFDRLDEICDDSEDFFQNPDPQKLAEILQLLRDSESLFPESASESEWDGNRMRYFSARLGYLSLAAKKAGDAEEKNAFYDECEKVAMTIAEPGYRQSVLDQISDLRQHGTIDPDQIRTVEDAMKNPKWQDLALLIVAQSLSRQEPPDFAEAIRAARLISDEDTVNRENCLSIIAVRQARTGLFDDAETTYRMITGGFKRLETLLTFIVIHDERGETGTAKQRIDEVFSIGQRSKDRSLFMMEFFKYCRSGLVLLTNPGLATYLYDKMVALKNDLGPESEQDYYLIQNDLTFMMTAAHLGEREAAQGFYRNARSIIAGDEAKWNHIDEQHRMSLIAALYDAGFDAEAAKELGDFIALIPIKRMKFPSSTPSICLKDLVAHCLATHGRFAEAIVTARVISGENERFEAYDWIVNEVRFRLHDQDERVQIDPPRKRFTSPQEVRAIADLLTDEPGGRSLESYRVKIRRYADNMPKNDR